MAGNASGPLSSEQAIKYATTAFSASLSLTSPVMANTSAAAALRTAVTRWVRTTGTGPISLHPTSTLLCVWCRLLDIVTDGLSETTPPYVKVVARYDSNLSCFQLTSP
jgi:hypothetical protein